MILHASPLAEVHLGDAAEVLPHIGTETVDLVITDPPYGEEWQSNRRAETFDQLLGDGSEDENRADVHRILVELVRIVGQNRHLYVFGPSDVLEGLKVSEPAELIWDKGRMGSGNLRAPWGPAHEPISFLVSKFRHAGKAGAPTLPARLRKGSVLRFPPRTGRNVRHPTEKPIGLLRELIESSSRQGELVVDPYGGVGSTGVAAVLSGRRTVIVEKHRPYAEFAVERIRRAEELAREGLGC